MLCTLPFCIPLAFWFENEASLETFYMSHAIYREKDLYEEGIFWLPLLSIKTIHSIFAT